jgi:RNA polymerase sigma-70 factor (ECF subfamily)
VAEVSDERLTAYADDALDPMDRATVEAGLDQLRPKERTLIAMVCVDGLTYQEASEILGVPVGTVMSRLARARLALHDAINRAQLYKAKTKMETHRGRRVR